MTAKAIWSPIWSPSFGDQEIRSSFWSLFSCDRKSVIRIFKIVHFWKRALNAFCLRILRILFLGKNTLNTPYFILAEMPYYIIEEI